MKLTAVLIMPVNTKDRHQVSSEKGRGPPREGVRISFPGKSCPRLPSVGQPGPLVMPRMTVINWFCPVSPSLHCLQLNLKAIPPEEGCCDVNKLTSSFPSTALPPVLVRGLGVRDVTAGEQVFSVQLCKGS